MSILGALRGRASGLPLKHARLLERHRRVAGDLLTQIDNELLKSNRTYRVFIDGREQVETYESLKAVASGQALLKNSSDIAVSTFVLAAERAFEEMRWGHPARQTLAALARKRLPATADDLTLAFLIGLRSHDKSYWWAEMMCMLVSAAEQFCKHNSVRPIEPVLRRTIEVLESKRDEYGDARVRARTRILALISTGGGSVSELYDKGDEWGRAMVEHPLIGNGPSELRSFLVHLAKAGGAPRPSAAWKKRCTELLKEHGDAASLTRTMLETAIDSEHQIETHRIGPDIFHFPWLFKEANRRLLRGAAWSAALINAEWSPTVLGSLGLRCVTGLGRMVSPIEMKVGNSCIAALAEVSSGEAIQHLLTLRSRVKERSILKQIEMALNHAAERAGVSKLEILESGISTMGLDSDGTKEVAVGEATALIAVAAPDGVNVQWRTGSGQSLSSIPREIVESSELRDFKRHVAAIKEALRIERLRMESLLSEEWRRPYKAWKQRTLGHPLTLSFARNLIWVVWSDGGRRLGIPLDGQRLAGLDGAQIHPRDEDQVELWHPIFSEADEVRAWRRYILENEIRQPFKQAFREIYRLTPPEVETGIYSNRFAVHILRYPQMYGLIKGRGWFGNALGPWDGGYDATIKRNFDGRGVRAEFYVEQVQDDDQGGPLAQLCATDQVRFYATRPASREPMPLIEVPPVVFSEAMRDVDLFVSVPSIATDPQWQDRGTDRHVAYWRETSFGELHETAKMRREALEYLLPKLKIAERCKLVERYLVVRGDLRTYKIHLGSANILMEPNDQYLCIVPARGRISKGDTRFLPFEDDYLFSVILSKAFMLAADRRIKDEQILAQIRR